MSSLGRQFLGDKMTVQTATELERLGILAKGSWKKGGGTGITTMPVLQSLAQAREKWGENAAAAIWESNRALALRLRAHLDWLRQPFWKLTILAAANLACTVPLTVAAVWLWLRYIHSPYPLADWLGTIRIIATDNTVTVLFLLYAYETLFLIRERHGDQRRLAHLERTRLAAQLENMKGQLAPHFLFNCLNTLAALIERDPPTAALRSSQR
jgi:hypothetical protein